MKDAKKRWVQREMPERSGRCGYACKTDRWKRGVSHGRAEAGRRVRACVQTRRHNCVFQHGHATTLDVQQRVLKANQPSNSTLTGHNTPTAAA